MSNLTLPLDSTGKATTNDITGEAHAIGSNPVRAFAPTYGAYFASSLVIVDAATGQPLTSAQFTPIIVLDMATAKYGAAVNDKIVGAVIITDPSVSANVVASYQALGGGYQLDLSGLVNDLILYEPATRPSAWPNVVDPLAATPVSQALHDAGQAGLITFEYVVHVLDRMTQMAIMGDPVSQAQVKAYADASENTSLTALNQQMALLNQHETNTSNPHRLTAHQLGAMTEAEQDAAIAAENTAMVAGDAANTNTLSTHEANHDNPHQLTLAQLGMYSQSQVNTNISAAQTSLNNTIVANAAVMNAHINSTSNPHQDNTTVLGTLTVSQIQTAIANATGPVSASTSASQSTLSAHVSNYANPHAVTPAQIGTWTAAALQALQNTLTSHTGNYANPHQVTVTQIGGMTQNQFNAALSTAQTNAQNYFNSNYNAMWGHINNTNNPHGVSAQYQLGALGPWNLGQLENDLSNAQNQINNSGHPITENSTGLQDNYTGQKSGAMNCQGGSYSGATIDALYCGGERPQVDTSWTWCCGSQTGALTPFSASSGAQVFAVMRLNNSLTVWSRRGTGSLAGMRLTTSIGDNVTLLHGLYYNSTNIWAGIGTVVGALGSGSRSYYVNISGSPTAGEPTINAVGSYTSWGCAGGIATATPTSTCSGGGKTCVTCFTAGAKVLMADYTWKNVEDVKSGELVMTPTGPESVVRLHRSQLGPKRKLVSFAEEPNLFWSDEHSFWAKQNGKQWWWAASPENWRAEVEAGAVSGLKDHYSHLEGQVEFAHLTAGFVKRELEVIEDASFETELYLPITTGAPVIINGYVVGASLNEWGYDYTQMDWTKLQRMHERHLQETLLAA